MTEGVALIIPTEYSENGYRNIIYTVPVQYYLVATIVYVMRTQMVISVKLRYLRLQHMVGILRAALAAGLEALKSGLPGLVRLAARAKEAG